MRYIFAFTILFSIQQLSAQNIFDKEHSIKYTNYLFDKEMYKQAADELERLNFQFPKDDSIRYLLLKSYRKSGNYSTGIRRTNEIFSVKDELQKNAASEYFKLLTLNNQIEEANSFLLKNNTLNIEMKSAFKLHLTLLSKNWQDAENQLSTTGENSENLCYKPLVEEGLGIKYKKPFVAGTMSAIIPGSGKMYSGFWQDGLLSLFSIGVSGWQAYSGFDKDGQNSAYGWTFTGLTGVLYLANIYGSVKSAKHINRFNEEKIIHKVQHCFDID